ncbi:MAG: hypothetical protein NC331_05325 [Lachnospiraceae bacterium]|nr:hypothetical protein [Lachnospiraceae bacterium]MCM1238788.1 hypothetical protein [Lachnospiraceae bacterium]
MKPPKDHWVIQIEVTNACIHTCSNCTRFCGHHKKPFFMDYDFFCKAVDSVMDHPGLIGVMGGEPTIHPDFKRMCMYLADKLPEGSKPDRGGMKLPTDSFIEVRRELELNKYEIYPYEDGPRPIIRGAGLWTSMTPKYLENYEIIQDVFNFQNLNDHQNISFHQPVLISRKDMGIGDKEWLRLRENCWVNQQWSSSVTPKGCFFCEVAAALDFMYNGPGGLPVEKGWWKRPIEDFAEQFQWCEYCGIPLETFARDAREGIDDISDTNYAVMSAMDNVRLVDQKINRVEIKDGIISEKSRRSAAEYHGVTYMEDAQDRVSGSTPIYARNLCGVMIYRDEAERDRDGETREWNGKHLKVLQTVLETDPVSWQHLMEDLPAHAYIVFMTAGIRMGEGFEKLKHCAVNPGTLHWIDFPVEGRNPYIDNGSELTAGWCTLVNRDALSLTNIFERMGLDGNKGEFLRIDTSLLGELRTGWDVDKQVCLSQEMDELMLGVYDRSNERSVRKRRINNGRRLVGKFIKQYGMARSIGYGIRIVQKYGVKLTVQKVKNRVM